MPHGDPFAIARFHNGDVGGDGATATHYDADQVMEHLQQHKAHIKELSLRQIMNDLSFATMVGFFIQHYELFHLTSFKLTKNDLTATSSQALASAYQAHISSLKILDLSDNPLAVQAGLALLVEAMMSSDCRLKHLNLNKNGIGNKREGPHCVERLLRSNQTIEELVLSRNNISSSNMKDIAHGLQWNKTIRRLDLSHNKIGDKGVGHLMACLDEEQSSCQLADLDMTFNKIGPSGAEYIGTLLNLNNRYITKLNLGLNAIGPAGAFFFGLALQYNHTLVELNLSRNNIQDSGASEIARGLLESNDSHLKILDLSWNSIRDTGAQWIARVLREKSTLQTLKLESNAIGDEGVDALADALHSDLSLNELDLVGNQMRNPSALVHLVCHGSYTLRRLNYSKNNMSADQELRMVHAFQFRENMKTWLKKLMDQIAKNRRVALNLQSKNYGDEEILVLSKHLAKYNQATITTASFQSSRLTDRGFCTFVNEVLSNSRAAQVQALYMYECSMLTDKSIRALAASLSKTYCPLKFLCLKNCNIGVQGAQLLADAILQNRRLYRLSLENNRIGDLGAKALLSATLDPPHSSLMSLNLANNMITDAALDHLGPLTKLEELHLDENYISDAGALDLCKSVMNSKSMQWLNLRQNLLSPKGIQALNLFLPNSLVLESSDQRRRS